MFIYLSLIILIFIAFVLISYGSYLNENFQTSSDILDENENKSNQPDDMDNMEDDEDGASSSSNASEASPDESLLKSNSASGAGPDESSLPFQLRPLPSTGIQTRRRQNCGDESNRYRGQRIPIISAKNPRFNKLNININVPPTSRIPPTIPQQPPLTPLDTLGKPATTLGSSLSEPSTLGSSPYFHNTQYSYFNSDLPPPSQSSNKPNSSPVIPPQMSDHPQSRTLQPSSDSASQSMSMDDMASTSLLTEHMSDYYGNGNGSAGTPNQQPMSSITNTNSISYNAGTYQGHLANLQSEYSESVSPEMYKDPKYSKFVHTLGNVPISALGSVCPSLYNDTQQGKKNSDTILNERVAKSPPRYNQNELAKMYMSEQIRAPPIYQLAKN